MPYKSKKKKVNYKKLKAITKQRKKAKKKIKKEVCDDAEFTSCQHCKSSVCAYNNTTRSATTPIDSEYTQTLLKLHSCNCEKCGKYVEFHPERSADASIIFLCSSATPCSHALCYDCGILYNLKTETNVKEDIVKALTTSEPTPTRGDSAEVGAESPEPTSDSDEDKTSKDILSSVAPSLAIVAEMMHGMDPMDMDMDMHTQTGKDMAVKQRKSDKQSSDGLIIGTMFALLVSNYVLGTMKTRKLKNVQLICIFAAIAYLGMYCIPFCLFLTLVIGAVSLLIVARCNFLSTLYDSHYRDLNVTIDLDLDENIEYDVITKG